MLKECSGEIYKINPLVCLLSPNCNHPKPLRPRVDILSVLPLCLVHIHVHAWIKVTVCSLLGFENQHSKCLNLLKGTVYKATCDSFKSGWLNTHLAKSLQGNHNPVLTSSALRAPFTSCLLANTKRGRDSREGWERAS